MPAESLVAKGATPPWLPREVAEARRFAWYSQILFFVMAGVWILLSVVALTAFVLNGGRGWLSLGLFGLIAMFMCVLSAIFMRKTVIDAIDQGRFNDARSDVVIWIVFGFVAFVLPSLLLILTYAKLSDSIAQQAPAGYMPYAPGTVAVQQPGQYISPPAPVQPQHAAPATAQQAPPPGHPSHSTPMARCKNCNVQYPMFMHSCPNCGAPKQP
ncbi:MAG TPA: hypothetical protein VGB78_01570 [Thermoplasmata archaeon]